MSSSVGLLRVLRKSCVGPQSAGVCRCARGQHRTVLHCCQARVPCVCVCAAPPQRWWAWAAAGAAPDGHVVPRAVWQLLRYAHGALHALPTVRPTRPMPVNCRVVVSAADRRQAANRLPGSAMHRAQQCATHRAAPASSQRAARRRQTAPLAQRDGPHTRDIQTGRRHTRPNAATCSLTPQRPITPRELATQCDAATSPHKQP
jgi:hypothetical protein